MEQITCEDEQLEDTGQAERDGKGGKRERRERERDGERESMCLVLVRKSGDCGDELKWRLMANTNRNGNHRLKKIPAASNHKHSLNK